MHKKTKYFAPLLAFFIFSHNAHSENDNIFPQFLEELPTYNVKYLPSPHLPQPNLQLTDRALRILPSYFMHTNIVKPYKIKIPESLNRIRLEQLGDKPYCSKSQKLCWPKSIEAVGQYLIVTSHQGDQVYYKDSKKLGVFLWDELRTPLKSLTKEK